MLYPYLRLHSQSPPKLTGLKPQSSLTISQFLWVRTWGVAQVSGSGSRLFKMLAGSGIICRLARGGRDCFQGGTFTWQASWVLSTWSWVLSTGLLEQPHNMAAGFPVPAASRAWCNGGHLMTQPQKSETVLSLHHISPATHLCPVLFCSCSLPPTPAPCSVLPKC